MGNPESTGKPHGVAIAGHRKGRIVQPGGVSRVTAGLRPGRYVFYCPVPGTVRAG